MLINYQKNSSLCSLSFQAPYTNFRQSQVLILVHQKLKLICCAQKIAIPTGIIVFTRQTKLNALENKWFPSITRSITFLFLHNKFSGTCTRGSRDAAYHPNLCPRTCPIYITCSVICPFSFSSRSNSVYRWWLISGIFSIFLVWLPKWNNSSSIYIYCPCPYMQLPQQW